MILEYDNVILGSSLSAFLLGWQNFWPVIFSDFEKPFRFDYFEPTVDFDFLNLPHQNRSLQTFGDDIEIGLPKYLLWERLHFMHSLSGLVPLSNLCTSFRASDNSLTCFNEYSKICEIKFNKCHYFGDNNVNGLLEKNSFDNEEYLCYDWVAFNKGGKHDIDYIETDDSFCKQIWFYPSDRIDGNTSVKDACIVSQLAQEQILNFNFSETMARFKLINEMEKRGMKGLFNGYNSAGNPRHYKFKTSHIRREKKLTNKNHILKAKGFENAKISKKVYNQMLQSVRLDSNLLLK